jgi:hypothetical protein
MPKLVLPLELASLLAVFAPCFTAPGFEYFSVLLLNFMAGTGRRTVASACSRSTLGGHWSNLVRWLSRVRKDVGRCSMAQCLLELLASRVALPRDGRGRRRLYVVVDETRVSKSKGATAMDNLQYWFNPHGGSCLGRYVWGHLWALVGILLPVGSDDRLRCFPLTAGLCRPKDKQQKSKNDASYTSARFSELLQGIDWDEFAADCPPMLMGDAAFGTTPFLDWTHEHGWFLMSHVQLNADVREILPPPSKRKRGRPRKWGDRIDLRKVYDDDSHFQPLPKPLYEEAVEGSYASLLGVLKRSGHVVRIALVKTEKYKPFAIVCTDLSLDPAEIVDIYTERFEIEIAIRELKDETGFGDYQVRRQHAIERHAQISIVACSLLKLLRTQPQLLGAADDVAAQTLPWKPSRDSFSTNQVRTLLQQLCTAQLIFAVLTIARVSAKNDRILNALRTLGFGMC